MFRHYVRAASGSAMGTLAVDGADDWPAASGVASRPTIESRPLPATPTYY